MLFPFLQINALQPVHYVDAHFPHSYVQSKLSFKKSCTMKNQPQQVIISHRKSYTVIKRHLNKRTAKQGWYSSITLDLYCLVFDKCASYSAFGLNYSDEQKPFTHISNKIELKCDKFDSLNMLKHILYCTWFIFSIYIYSLFFHLS